MGTGALPSLRLMPPRVLTGWACHRLKSGQMLLIGQEWDPDFLAGDLQTMCDSGEEESKHLPKRFCTNPEKGQHISCSEVLNRLQMTSWPCATSAWRRVRNFPRSWARSQTTPPQPPWGAPPCSIRRPWTGSCSPPPSRLHPTTSRGSRRAAAAESIDADVWHR